MEDKLLPTIFPSKNMRIQGASFSFKSDKENISLNEFEKNKKKSNFGTINGFLYSFILFQHLFY